MDSPKTLIESLALERIELNLFRGTSPQAGGRLFGGHVIAQSLLAAYETVEGRTCHSLHCYFIHPGEVRVPILYEVDRARDGGSFTTRRVIAIQRGRQIFNLAASFQVEEQGLEHQAEMPAMPDPEGLPEFFPALRRGPRDSETEQTRTAAQRPVDVRAVGSAALPGGPKQPRNAAWLRATTEIGPHPRLQQAVLAYSSDMTLLATAIRPHPIDWRRGMAGLQSASLDHAMWFHRPSNLNQWHLYNQESPSASGGRGLVRGSIFNQSGTLVASVAQEILIRVRPANPPTE